MQAKLPIPFQVEDRVSGRVPLKLVLFVPQLRNSRCRPFLKLGLKLEPTVATASFAHPILDSPTLQGCHSKMAEWADGWVRLGGRI